MKNVNKMYLVTLALIGTLSLGGFGGFGQQQPAIQEDSTAIRGDFTPDELESFVKANEKVNVVQQEAEEKIIEKIEEEGLTVERFNEILESRRNPESSEEPTPEELASFNQAAQMIVTENQAIEGKIMSVIEEEGIDVDTYQQIMVAYQQNPEVKQKVDKLLDENP